MGKIKKAAKRKLSKRRYSESSSESEKSDSEPSRHTRRSAAKKINYKAIAGTDSEATEVSEDKSESEEDKMSKKKNVIRDDSTDTDDYYDSLSSPLPLDFPLLSLPSSESTIRLLFALCSSFF
jgi:hypothetical protein